MVGTQQQPRIQGGASSQCSFWWQEEMAASPQVTGWERLWLGVPAGSGQAPHVDCHHQNHQGRRVRQASWNMGGCLM